MTRSRSKQMTDAQAVEAFDRIVREILEETNYSTVRELSYQLKQLLIERELPLANVLAVLDQVTSGQ